MAPSPSVAAPGYSAQRDPLADAGKHPGYRGVRRRNGEVGQPLCALEAMKMKSIIRSPREGVISAVHVSEGQVVVHGELLFSFE